MSTKKTNTTASTQAKLDCASDYIVNNKHATALPESPEVKSPPGVRSVALKLQTNPKRRSLFGRSNSCRRGSTVPRSIPTELYQEDSQSVCRPSTAPVAQGRIRRSKAENLRLSFLGARKKLVDDVEYQEELNDDPSAFHIRPDTRSGPSCNSPQEHFKTGKQYYRHLKKCSISPPFGFEHITHAAKEQLSGIKSADEQDLSAQFWSVTRNQSPCSSLRGIRADNLTHRRPSMVFGSVGRSRTASQDSRRRSSASSGNRSNGASSVPRKDSNTLQPAVNQVSSCDYVTRPSREQTKTVRSPSRHASMASADAKVRSKTDKTSQDMKDPSQQLRQSHSKRATRTLPPLPEQSTLYMESNWEDDVDLCYELEAEATCDFDWETGTASEEPSSSGVEPEIRDSVWSTQPVNKSLGSLQSPKLPQPEVITHDFAEQPRKRGSSVGHRGFLAARSSNQSLSASANSPIVAQIRPTASDEGLPSPTIVLTPGDELSCKTPCPQNALNLSSLPPSTLEELSDPESTRTGGSRHRKSSSFGSSSARSTRSTTDGNGNRWSLASFASVPELLYSHRRNKTSVGKIQISAPFDSPQSSPTGVGASDFENPRENVGTKTLRQSQTPGERAAASLQSTATVRASLRGKALASREFRLPLTGRRLRETSSLGNGPQWI